MKHLTRRHFVGFLAGGTLLAFAGCSKADGTDILLEDGGMSSNASENASPSTNGTSSLGDVDAQEDTTINEGAPQGDTEGATAQENSLVVYFSRTGNTQPIAEYAAQVLGVEPIRLEAAEPYTDADIKYYTDCRADREQADQTVRPALAGELPNLSACDTLLLGFPIWHGQAPRLINTFLDASELAGKTILCFCTSGSSPIGPAVSQLQGLYPEATWLEGHRFSTGASKEEVAAWVNSVLE